jgi:hypothetical protein
MKSTLIFITLIAISGVAVAQKYVNGYTKKDGTYVQGHNKSSPDHFGF